MSAMMRNMVKHSAKLYDLRDLEGVTLLSLISSSYKKILNARTDTGKLWIPLSLKSEGVLVVGISIEMLKVAIRNAEKSNIKLNTIVCVPSTIALKTRNLILLFLPDFRCIYQIGGKVSKSFLGYPERHRY